MGGFGATRSILTLGAAFARVLLLVPMLYGPEGGVRSDLIDGVRTWPALVAPGRFRVLSVLGVVEVGEGVILWFSELVLSTA